MSNESLTKQSVDHLINTCHGKAKESGWWTDLMSGRDTTVRVTKVEAMSALLALELAFKSGNLEVKETENFNQEVYHTLMETISGYIVTRNMGEMLMLIVSEVAEAMEADRKGLMDDKLPHRDGVEVELADTVIRIADLAGGMGYDLAGALVEKLEYNSQRADHKPENRLKDDGKKY